MHLRRISYRFCGSMMLIIASLFTYGQQDSLPIFLERAENATSTKAKVNHLLDAGGWISEIDSSLNYFIEARELARSITYTEGLAKSYKKISNYFQKRGFREKAIKNNEEALVYFRALGNKNREAVCLNDIGYSYKNMGNYEKALDYYLQALRILEEEEDAHKIAIGLNNVGEVYTILKKTDQALDVYKKALKVSEDAGDVGLTARSINNIGVYYRRNNQPEKAKENYEKCLQLYESINDSASIVNSLTNLGVFYSTSGNIETGLEYLFKALDIIDNSRPENKAIITGNIAATYYNNKQYDKAFAYADTCRVYAQKAGSKFVEERLYLSLGRWHEKLGNKDMALISYKKHYRLKDSLLNAENLKKIEELATIYKVEEKEKQIQLLNKEANLAERESELKDAKFNAELERQTTRLKLIIGGSILALLIAAFIFIFYRKQAKNRESMLRQKQTIKQQEAAISGQQEERRRIAKDLHDGLGGSLAGIKLRLEQINNPILDNVVEELSIACKEVRTISHNLMPSEIVDNDFTEVVQHYIDGSNIGNALQISFDAFPPEEFNEMPKPLQVDVFRVIQELTTNAIKHARATRLDINLSKEADEITLLVEDNGKGFDKEKVDKGLGLTNIESRVSHWKGSVTIDSEIERGTAFCIVFQVS
jgi:signal transduction histidine kinase